MDDETRDEAMEYCIGIVAIKTVLKKIARGERGLVGEKFKGDITRGGIEEYLGGRLRFEVVQSAHLFDCTLVEWFMLYLDANTSKIPKSLTLQDSRV